MTDKAWNDGFIKLDNPDEVVNLEVGQIIWAVNRYDGSFTVNPNAETGPLRDYPSPEHRKP